MSTRAKLITAAFCVLIATGSAWAQPLGTFRWQQQPYCNVLTLNVISEGGNYTLDGTDDLCGATHKASVAGIAYLNPDSTIGFGLTLVTPPGAAPLHINATITLASLGGTWNDSDGNTGNFVFTPGASTGGSTRPASLPRFHVNGTSWFQGDNTPLPASAGKGIAIGSLESLSIGYIFGYDYGTLGPMNLVLNHAGGNVGIGTINPQSRFHVNGTSWFQGNSTPLPVSAGKGIAIGFPEGLSTGYIYGFDYGTGTPTNLALNHAGGNVGIGTLNPTRAKVEIVGSQVFRSPIVSYASLDINGAVTGVGEIFTATSLATDAYILSSLGFVAASDERIKRIEGRSDGTRDLATLAGIEVTDYTYIDTVTKGTRKHKKVIGQQVEKVYPQAVSRSTDVVPDIYKKAQIKDGWVSLATNLKKGERVRLIGKKNEGIHEVLEVAPGKFRTDFAADGDAVFVYGREVKDFRNVDYEAIAMLNVSATQELHRRLEKQAADFAAQAQEMSKQAATISMQTTRIAELEKQASEIAMLKQQMAELQAARLTAGRLDAARLTAAR